MRLKIYLLLFIALPLAAVAVAQSDSNKIPGNTKPVKKPAVVNTVPRKDSPVAKRNLSKSAKDSLPKKILTTRAQKTPVAGKPDSVNSFIADSLKNALPKNNAIANTWKSDSLYSKLFDVPYLPVKEQPVLRIDSIRPYRSLDELFYVIAGILFFLGFIRLFFPKYFHNMLRMFFETSFRQKQSREQLSQDRLPSLLMNILFSMVGGVFIALAATRNNWLPEVNFWLLLLYCSALLAGIYMIKYLVLQLTGWIFNAKELAGTYSFIVFLINKILGLVLLPLLLLYAFSAEEINRVLITIITSLVVLMFGYRYIVSLSTIRSNLKMNAIHFFIYLCAVEIVPMIIIYKVLFNFVSKNI